MKESVLFLEGKDDCYVVANLCKHRNVRKNFELKECGSKDDAIRQLELAINEQASTYTTVGIMIDADTDNHAAWQKVKSKIEATGRYENVPKTLPKNGLTLDAKESVHPRIGVWIMPDNQTKGMLEDFVALLADDGDQLMHEADQVLHSLEARKLNNYKPVHRAKAKIHTYLAWQDEPGKPMGQAITAHILNADSTSADSFMEWIVQLFTEE